MFFNPEHIRIFNMANNTATKIRELQKEVRELRQIVDDEIFWHPTIEKEIRRRSVVSRRHLGKLKNVKEVFASLKR